MRGYIIVERGSENAERVTAKNFHIRYVDGNCDKWQVVIKGQLIDVMFHTSSDYTGLWMEDNELINPNEIKFSKNANYRMKQIRKLMMQILFVYGE